MARPRLAVSEYRSYELPADFPVLALQGEEWRISPVRSTRLHFHNCLEIGVCLSDSGSMLLEDQEEAFRTGTVTFIAPHVLHTTWSAPGAYSLWSYLYLDVETLLGGDLMELPDIRELHLMLSGGKLMLHADSCPWASRLVQGILEELSERQPGYQGCVRGLLLALISRLLRIYMKEPKRTDKQILTLTPALEYIHQNYMNSFPMEDLAALCHLSPTHFRRLFHEQIGTNPLDFVHQVRVAASCMLLRSTNRSVADIASQVGYASLSAYNRQFLRVMGHTPSAWRRSKVGEIRSSVLNYTGWQKAETSEEILSKNR